LFITILAEPEPCANAQQPFFLLGIIEWRGANQAPKRREKPGHFGNIRRNCLANEGAKRQGNRATGKPLLALLPMAGSTG
jgi:hypothetical protein